MDRHGFVITAATVAGVVTATKRVAPDLRVEVKGRQGSEVICRALGSASERISATIWCPLQICVVREYIEVNS